MRAKASPTGAIAFPRPEPHTRWYWLTLFGVPACCAAAAVVVLPFAAPMPDYWGDALELARTGRIAQRFTPSGYPLTIALGVRLFAAHPAVGCALEQALLHLLLVAALWAVMRRLGASARAALIGGLMLQAAPEILMSIMKVWDVAFSTLLLLLTTWVALQVLQQGGTVRRCALLGAVFAYGCFDRPNYLSLLPGLGVAIWWGVARTRAPRESRTQKSVQVGLMMGTLLLTAAGVYAGTSLLAYHGLHTPGNGAYNLFAGNNAFSRGALLEKLNAEPSIVPALRAAGVDMSGRTPDAASLQPFYRASAAQFALQHPRDEGLLMETKLLTLLRPDTKVHPLLSAPGFAKGVLSGFVPVWLLVVGWGRLRSHMWLREDGLIALSAALYVLPFLVTNADPRFRTPLDLLLGAHLVGMLWRRAAGRAGIRTQAFADA